LKLDKNILNKINQIKAMFHSETHKKMGYPLRLYHIAAILLYCSGDGCFGEFNEDEGKFNYVKWKWLDYCLTEAVTILSHYENRESHMDYLYSGVCNVKVKDIQKIRHGNFVRFVSTSFSFEVAKEFKGGDTLQGCILHFHPSMRRASTIYSCSVEWISPHKKEKEILFTRSQYNENTSWNAVVKDDDGITQTVVLTWSEYDKYMSHLEKFTHETNGNVLCVALEVDKDPTKLLNQFQLWKNDSSNISKFNETKINFQNTHCWDDEVNLFCYFLESIHRVESALKLSFRRTMKGLPI